MNYYAGIGSRETPTEILRLMTAIAETLRDRSWILRSGGAQGADQAFEAGAGLYKQIFIPWLGFEGSSSQLLPTQEAFTIASEFHPAWDRCSRGARALHARNVHQILGEDLRSPVTMVICWTKDGGFTGGTGQALRIADHHKIAIFNLHNRYDRERIERFVQR